MLKINNNKTIKLNTVSAGVSTRSSGVSAARMQQPSLHGRIYGVPRTAGAYSGTMPENNTNQANNLNTVSARVSTRSSGVSAARTQQPSLHGRIHGVPGTAGAYSGTMPENNLNKDPSIPQTLYKILYPTLVTTKFLVLTILVFVLAACGTGKGTQAPRYTSDIAKPFVASKVSPATITCNTEQSTLAEALLTLTNQTRASSQRCGRKRFPAAAPLRLNPVLSLSAKVHSNDMAAKDFFSHQGSNGLQVWGRAQALGYQYRIIAENIAAGHESAEEVHAGWINSPSHCKSLMNPAVTDFGAACSDNPDAELKRYWGTVFAQPRARKPSQATLL